MKSWSYDNYEDKSYEVTSLKYQSFDISQVIISNMWTAVLPVSCSINSTFRLINDPKKRTLLHQWFKSKLDKSYESLFFQILTSWYQSRDHFKYVECNTSSLIFDNFDLSDNKRVWKRNSFTLMLKNLEKMFLNWD